MADGEAPEKVRRKNNVRWKECAKMAKVERKLLKRLQEDPGQKTFIPAPSLPSNISERAAVERGSGADAQGQCEAEQRG